MLGGTIQDMLNKNKTNYNTNLDILGGSGLTSQDNKQMVEQMKEFVGKILFEIYKDQTTVDTIIGSIGNLNIKNPQEKETPIEFIKKVLKQIFKQDTIVNKIISDSKVDNNFIKKINSQSIPNPNQSTQLKEAINLELIENNNIQKEKKSSSGVESGSISSFPLMNSQFTNSNYMYKPYDTKIINPNIKNNSLQTQLNNINLHIPAINTLFVEIINNNDKISNDKISNDKISNDKIKNNKLNFKLKDTNIDLVANELQNKIILGNIVIE